VFFFCHTQISLFRFGIRTHGFAELSLENLHAFILAFAAGIVKEITYIRKNNFIVFNVNSIFAAVFLLSAAIFLVLDPDGFLPALLAGGQKAATLSISLLAIYCVWLGFFKVLEKSGISEKLARMFFPLSKRLFRSRDREAVTLAGCNLSANLLGLPGAPTPLGIKATEAFSAKGNTYGAAMLFVLNATSLQLLPTTVIALRAAAGSASAADILLPTLLSTALSTILGVLAVRLLLGRKQKRR